jgi:hypothetical protein
VADYREELLRVVRKDQHHGAVPDGYAHDPAERDASTRRAPGSMPRPAQNLAARVYNSPFPVKLDTLVRPDFLE